DDGVLPAGHIEIADRLEADALGTRLEERPRRQRERDVDRAALLSAEAAKGFGGGARTHRQQVENDDVLASAPGQSPGKGGSGDAAAQDQDHGSRTRPRP